MYILRTIIRLAVRFISPGPVSKSTYTSRKSVHSVAVVLVSVVILSPYSAKSDVIFCLVCSAFRPDPQTDHHAVIPIDANILDLEAFFN